MSIIDIELKEIRKLCENVVPNSKIIACTSDPPFVRVGIQENQHNRQIIVCLRFPADYPQQLILVELKSRTLSDKFLDSLTSLCEQQFKPRLGKPHGLNVLRFVQKYLQDNPLCVCFDEIQELRLDLAQNQLRLKQRLSTLLVTAKGGEYFYRVSAIIPDDYPRRCVELKQSETNLPAVLLRYLDGQSREIARQCVEPPVRLGKDEKTIYTFQQMPSLSKALKFCIEATRDFCSELCPICGLTVLPEDPNNLELDDSKDAFVERVYCGHLFHQGCLRRYLQEPPFPKGGKLCPAKRRHPRSDVRYYLGGGANVVKQPVVGADTGGICGIRLAHDRWVVSVKVAESRWAKKQARERELEEVVDFLN